MLVTRIRDAVHADAANWGVSRRAADILLLLPFAGALLVVVAYAYRPAFRFLTDEDALLEWLQVGCWVGTAIFAVLCARELTGRRMPAWRLAYLALAAGCVFVIGDELAWGQRILGFGTPESVREINHQGETTIHNIGGLQTAFNVALLIAGLYGLAVSWLAGTGRLQRWREFRVLAVPPLFLSSAFLVLFGYKALRFTLFQEPRYPVVRAGELPELCLPAALVVMMLLVRRRLRDAPARADVGREVQRRVDLSREALQHELGDAPLALGQSVGVGDQRGDLPGPGRLEDHRRGAVVEDGALPRAGR
jgi:cbb3-type cytochrome oxidase subunit 3